MADWQAFQVADSSSISRLRDAGIYVEIDRERHITAFSPNDSLFSAQWGLTASNGAWRGDFRDAWAITEGDSSVKIGIIDCGSPWKNGTWTHPDLDSSRCFAALNFLSFTSNDSDGTVTDYSGHSTHVAGIISAMKDNHIGVAGIDQHARIGFYKAFSMYGSGFDSDIANAIYRAVHDGCKVLSMSFGGSGYTRVLEDAMYYVFQHGVFSAVAAGNSAAETESYPAFFGNFSTRAGYRTGLPGIVSVGALDQSGNIAEYSNRGWFVDIFAPGGSGARPYTNRGNVLSTLPTYSCVLGRADSNWYYEGDSVIVISVSPEQRTYGYLAGTSMATPFIAGTAALMLAVNPSLTPNQIKQGLTQGVDSIMTTYGAIPVLDPSASVLLAKKGTILAVKEVQQSTPERFLLFQNYPNPFNPTTNIAYSLPKAAHVTLEIYNLLGEKVRTLVEGEQTAGIHSVSFDGNTFASGTYFYRLRAGGNVEMNKMVLLK